MSLSSLNEKIIRCQLCPRLVEWRKQIAGEKVARFSEWDYWGKPVPSFGDCRAQLLIVGLAPAAHGANRTGRMFTGDRSGEWLYRTLYTFGFASKPDSIAREDGLTLKNCYITAAVHCAPPGNKPLPAEFRNCGAYLLEELRLLNNVRVIIGLGKLAFESVFDAAREMDLTALVKRPAFFHGAEYSLSDDCMLIASFHPSQQNTFTGKLTQPMFDAVFRRAKKILELQKARTNGK